MNRTNTSTIPDFFATLLSGTGVIEEQEARGQREIVKSESLPTPDAKTRAQYEQLGFIFGTPVDDDPLFTHVILPKGWSLAATDHSMHNSIVDERGRVRGSFFYKSSFYDRKADLYEPSHRYRVTKHYEPNRVRATDSYDDYKIVHYDVVDNTDSAVIFSVKRIIDLLSPNKGGEHGAWWNEHNEVEKLVCAECVAWLDENYPEHGSCSAYWD